MQLLQLLLNRQSLFKTLLPNLLELLHLHLHLEYHRSVIKFQLKMLVLLLFQLGILLQTLSITLLIFKTLIQVSLLQLAFYLQTKISQLIIQQIMLIMQFTPLLTLKIVWYQLEDMFKSISLLISNSIMPLSCKKGLAQLPFAH